MNPENMKTPLEVLNEYNLSDFLMTSLKRNSTKKPLFKLNPLFENYFKVCSEDLPYKDIYKTDSMFPQEFHKQVKQIAERGKIKKSGNYHELLVLAEREKRKFLIKGTEVG
ncbi:hypothetical protein LHV56_13470 [Peribacillus frigoritolerans]|uniref:hypothetical protein n=1 Tax=Peribacillus frigoritolerans TaxID=450367 RepID=UPI0006C44146|nr:hypothetical protein [Peribacillus frigoritolerans]KOR82915.1 hypothetical protein AM233_01320 [Bacillus sp. FJAT-22058]USK77930.1 hypothetical protein LHV56_13470 [Peribacillus frigoritolerans]